MKNSLLLYLFIAAILLNVFTYMFYSGEVKYEKNRFTAYDKKINDSITSITNKSGDANYFSLEKNQNAQEYFDNDDPKKYIDYQKLIPIVTNKLMEYNDDPNGNKYTGQEKIGVNKFIINKAKILNHRWIIADYTDGTFWGEVLLKYFVNDDKTISFEVIQSLIYQKHA